MKKKRHTRKPLVVFVFSAFLLYFFAHTALSQKAAVEKGTRRSIGAIKSTLLVGDEADLRYWVLEPQDVLKSVANGAVIFVGQPSQATGFVREFSTNSWRTFSDALKHVKATAGKNANQQVRLIKQDHIVQVPRFYYDLDSVANGVGRTPLEAGDIVLITLVSE